MSLEKCKAALRKKQQQNCCHEHCQLATDLWDTAIEQKDGECHKSVEEQVWEDQFRDVLAQVRERESAAEAGYV